MEKENKRLKHDVGNLGYKIKNQRKEIERQIAQNAQLKELLKDIRNEIVNSELALSPRGFKQICEIIRKIDEVLK